MSTVTALMDVTRLWYDDYQCMWSGEGDIGGAAEHILMSYKCAEQANCTESRLTTRVCCDR